MKHKTWLVILATIGVLSLTAALAVMSGTSTTAMVVAVPTDQELVYTSTLRMTFEPGHKLVTSTEVITIESASITQEIRDKNGNVVATQTKPVPDFQVAYAEEDIPEGSSSSPLTFSVTLPHRGPFEEWVRGIFTGTDGHVHTFTVPASPSLAIDPRGFALINILEGEWYDTCSPSPPTPTLYPTQEAYTPAPTYTSEPIPTCRPPTYPSPLPTLTPLPTSTLYPTSTPYPAQP